MFENNNDDIGRYQIMTSWKQKKSLFPTAEDFAETVVADCQLD